MVPGVGRLQRRRASPLGLSAVCVGVVAAAAVLSVAQGAAAAPACLQSVRDRYEPGNEVTVVGYGCVREPSVRGARDLPVAFGYLHVMPPDPCADVDPTVYCNPEGYFRQAPPVDPASGIPLGQMVVEESPHPLRGLRVSLTFRLPRDLAPGTYYILICGQPCAADERAYLPFPWPLYVGVDPPAGERPVHAWPLDDPAVDLLPDDARLLGPDGDEVTVAELRTQSTVATEPGDDPTRLILWIAATALVLPAGWAVSRVGPPRKRIRPGS